jgi:sugar O-acyltransferase (sialic acid O-acetyltransferase NeuD family)
MTGDLIILGAGGSSREIAELVADLNRAGQAWKLSGFLDDDPAKTGRLVDGFPILGPLSSVGGYPEARFVLGIASYKQPDLRRSIIARLHLLPERFATLVHPSASVSSLARLGQGAAVLHNVVITSTTVIGDHVLISQGAMLGHDVTVGSYATIAPAAIVSGGVRVEECVYIGAGAVIAPGVAIGSGALIGVGAVVIADVDSGSTVFGNPARTINRSAGGFRRWTP